ncbi:MAG: BatA domain-containing protein, partial [Verrucomicrobia bacterium]|nr:BatA domain-containing protein [Verrucomicrobiota bacterium]
MTFLKWSMLLGLVAIAIPIIIHLLNRNKPRVINWGAMQFLRAALITRRRRLQMEEMILLCLRCLSLALIALAMARPFLPSASAIPWAVIVPAILIAVALTGMATVLWSNQSLRRRLLRAAAILATLGIAFAVLERWIQARHWLTAGGGRDVVIVLDASMSMSLQTADRTAFQQAVAEARTLIRAARPGDAFAIVLGGAVPEALILRPTSDRGELLGALDGPACRIVGGRMSAPEAVNLASTLLADGPNAAKMIVIFTDGQAAGWDTRADARWKFVASGFASLPTPPRLVIRRLSPPAAFRNAAVTSLQLSRRVIGTDRPVKIDVSIFNAGSAPMQPSAIELFVGSNRVERIPIMKELLPQATEIFRFEHTFAQPGYHVLRADLVADDDLPSDNALVQVAHVIDRLPVLLVEGASSERFFFRRASSFVRTALTPDGRDSRQNPSEADSALRFLVDPTIVEASGLQKIPDLSIFRVIILADVPRLPTDEADRLSAFVKKGGGLLVTPGQRALPAFYNAWQADSGEPVMPAPLGERLTPPDPLRLKAASLTHPALRLIGQRDQSDIALGFFSAYWTLKPDAATPLVSVGAQFESDAPWLVDRQLGRGHVLTTATAFDRRESTLPSLKCFVPLIHEMVYFLAAPMVVNANVEPGIEWTLEVAMDTPPDPNTPVTVATPTGTNRPVSLTSQGRQFTLRFPETRHPGLYRVQLPAPLATAAGVRSDGVGELPFAVNTTPEESSLDLLSDSDLAALGRQVDLYAPPRLEDLLAVQS